MFNSYEALKTSLFSNLTEDFNGDVLNHLVLNGEYKMDTSDTNNFGEVVSNKLVSNIHSFHAKSKDEVYEYIKSFIERNTEDYSNNKNYSGGFKIMAAKLYDLNILGKKSYAGTIFYVAFKKAEDVVSYINVYNMQMKNLYIKDPRLDPRIINVYMSKDKYFLEKAWMKLEKCREIILHNCNFDCSVKSYIKPIYMNNLDAYIDIDLASNKNHGDRILFYIKENDDGKYIESYLFSVAKESSDEFKLNIDIKSDFNSPTCNTEPYYNISNLTIKSRNDHLERLFLRSYSPDFEDCIPNISHIEEIRFLQAMEIISQSEILVTV